MKRERPPVAGVGGPTWDRSQLEQHEHATYYTSLPHGDDVWVVCVSYNPDHDEIIIIASDDPDDDWVHDVQCYAEDHDIDPDTITWDDLIRMYFPSWSGRPVPDGLDEEVEDA